jgi:hypothetical protein
MKRSSRTVTSFASVVRGAAVKLTALGGVLTGVAGAAGLVLLVRSALKTVDAIAKMSSRLGIATDKLIGLQFAAKLAGIEANTMNLGLQRMVRRIAEAAQGTGEAQAALKELGLSAQALAEMTPDEALRRVADALRLVKSQSDRVRLAFKLFDSEGVALVNMLKNGAAGLNAMQAEAKALGLTLTTIEAAQIEEANNAISRMTALLTGFGRQLTAQLAPFMTVIVDKFVELGTSGEDMGTKVSKGFEVIITSIGGLIDWLDRAKGEFHLFSAAAKQSVLDVSDSFKSATSVIKGFVAARLVGSLEEDAPVGAIGKLKIFIASMLVAQDEASQLGTAFRDAMEEEIAADIEKAAESLGRFEAGAGSQKVKDFFDEVRRASEETAKAMDEVSEAQERQSKSFKDAQDALKAEEAAEKRLKSFAEGVARSVRTPFEVLEDEIEKLEEALAALFLDPEDFARAIEQATEKFAKATEIKSADFQQIDLARTAFGGVGPSAKKDPQIEETNKLLKQIERHGRVAPVPVAA